MIFQKLFFEWNATHNLSAVRTKEMFEQYCLDCAYPLSFVRPFSSLLDVGSGGGFPALVLGAFKPSVRLLLVEPNHKKAAFLKLAALEMGLDCVVLRERIENLHGIHTELLSSRALCAPKALMPLIAHIQYQTLLLYAGSKTAYASDEFVCKHYEKLSYLYKEL